MASNCADNNKNFVINHKNYDDIEKLAQIIKNLANIKYEPEFGIICGSGLSNLGDQIIDSKIISFKDIPNFPQTNVIGHKSNLIFGRISNTYVICFQGRFHPYEHKMDLALCTLPIRLMHILGVKNLIVSNAAGGIDRNYSIGDLMIIRDQIYMPGLSGFSPIMGLDDPRFGPRFVSMHQAYDKEYRNIAKQVASDLNIKIHEGVYVMNGGPQYETPMEINFYKTIGGNAVGMSTCHEVIVARQCGIRVFGFSLITNICNLDPDTSVEVTHNEVLESGRLASEKACTFVTAIIKKISNKN